MFNFRGFAMNIKNIFLVFTLVFSTNFFASFQVQDTRNNTKVSTGRHFMMSDKIVFSMLYASGKSIESDFRGVVLRRYLEAIDSNKFEKFDTANGIGEVHVFINDIGNPYCSALYATVCSNNGKIEIVSI